MTQNIPTLQAYDLLKIRHFCISYKFQHTQESQLPTTKHPTTLNLLQSQRTTQKSTQTKTPHQHSSSHRDRTHPSRLAVKPKREQGWNKQVMQIMTLTSAGVLVNASTLDSLLIVTVLVIIRSRLFSRLLADFYSASFFENSPRNSSPMENKNQNKVQGNPHPRVNDQWILLGHSTVSKSCCENLS